MKKIEDLLFRVFKALLKSYGKIEGYELFKELLSHIDFSN